ncbi:DNA-processing protein DprA, partial [Streptomyces nojiriensis]|uniref:DNA-processing protein DprA n=1 Tax=Streptomyces nojiriensis TaxID=66374 RepID=UPI003651F270
MSGPGDAELSARAALTRVLEPGDAHGGRWLREFGAVRLIRLLTDPGAEPDTPSGVGPDRLAGYRMRAALADPERDLADAAEAGGRFVHPGSGEWPTQLDDLGDERPVGLWLRGRPNLRTWALRSVSVVGARACTPYGAHMAQTLAGGLAERGWVVGGGAAGGGGGAPPPGGPGGGGARAGGRGGRGGGAPPR